MGVEGGVELERAAPPEIAEAEAQPSQTADQEGEAGEPAAAVKSANALPAVAETEGVKSVEPAAAEPSLVKSEADEPAGAGAECVKSEVAVPIDSSGIGAAEAAALALLLEAVDKRLPEATATRGHFQELRRGGRRDEARKAKEKEQRIKLRLRPRQRRKIASFPKRAGNPAASANRTLRSQLWEGEAVAPLCSHSLSLWVFGKQQRPAQLVAARVKKRPLRLRWVWSGRLSFMECEKHTWSCKSDCIFRAHSPPKRQQS